MEIITATAKETKDLGRNFAGKFKNGGVICLLGDLGSGKTTFTQGLAEGLGLKRRIVSPTFIIARQYELTEDNTKEDSGGSYFYHVDLYRLSSLEEAKAIGIEEMWQKNNIVVIEWPEKIASVLPRVRYEINFVLESLNLRKIRITKIH